jgi:Tfp pilus assembly protein PilF
MGDDAKGLKYLKEAWRGDPFNVRNYNLLNLFEDVVAKEYTFISTKHFRFRVHKKEKELVQRTMAPLLEQAYGIYVKKYRFKPAGPIIIELFRDPSHYAVRTVGLPGLGALGVCFGRVITTSSPMNGRFNWGQVLWHELNHVFTIQMTRSRVPRWLTEGLADMEPVQHRPEWKRENDFDIYRALRAGRLKGLASMRTAFSRAKNLQEMVVAYYQGSLLATFLIKHWGMKKMLKALREYGKGNSTEQIIPTLTGLGLAEIDRRFKSAQLKRLAHYSRSWYVDLESYDDLKSREKQAKAKPGDSAAQAALAVALLVAGKHKQAGAQAEKVLKRDIGNRLSLYVRARVAEPKAAQVYWRRLLAAGGDGFEGFETRLALGKGALSRKDLKEAQRHLNAAKQLDPEKGHPYALLAKAYEKQKKIDKVIDELKGLARLEQQSFGMVAKLVSLLAKKKDYKALRTYGEMAYYINPASIKLHTHLAEAFTASAPKPDLTRAIWHLETALLCQPKKPADLHVKLARLHLRRGDRRRAKNQLDRALKADPKHAGAKDLRKKL